MAWKPVFSPNNRDVAVKIEKNGKFSIVLNDKLWDQTCDAIWDPVFNLDGDKILVRTLQDGKFTRRVISVKELLR